MNVTILPEAGVTRVELEGSIDGKTAPQIREELSSALQEVQKLIVDMSRVDGLAFVRIHTDEGIPGLSEVFSVPPGVVRAVLDGPDGALYYSDTDPLPRIGFYADATRPLDIHFFRTRERTGVGDARSRFGVADVMHGAASDRFRF